MNDPAKGVDVVDANECDRRVDLNIRAEADLSKETEGIGCVKGKLVKECGLRII